MIRRLGAVLAMLSVLVLAPALALSAVSSDVVLSGPAPVRIWTSQAAMEKGQDLLAASAAPDVAALAALLACEVAPGTRATVTRAESSYAWDAEVAEGPQRGCRGVVGPRDFKTEADLAPRPPAEERPAAPARPAPAQRSDQWMVLWYQFYILANDRRARTTWSRVAAWETTSECDTARRRLTEADDREINEILDRFEVFSRALRGRLTMTHTPREYGLDLELSNLTREGRRTAHLEVRSYCFPASHNPQH